MTAEQAMSYVNTLNNLFVNKVITLAEFRKALQYIPMFENVCQPTSDAIALIMEKAAHSLSPNNYTELERIIGVLCETRRDCEYTGQNRH